MKAVRETVVAKPVILLIITIRATVTIWILAETGPPVHRQEGSPSSIALQHFHNAVEIIEIRIFDHDLAVALPIVDLYPDA